MFSNVKQIFRSELFLMLMVGVISYTAFVAVILATLQVPPEAILHSGLKEVLLVFEG